MEEKKVTLIEPVTVAGQEVREVTLRRSTIGDEEDAMQQAIALGRKGNPLTTEACLLSRVTGLPYDVLRSMHGPNYAAIRAAHNALFGHAPEEPAENPTTVKQG